MHILTSSINQLSLIFFFFFLLILSSAYWHVYIMQGKNNKWIKKDKESHCLLQSKVVNHHVNTFYVPCLNRPFLLLFFFHNTTLPYMLKRLLASFCSQIYIYIYVYIFLGRYVNSLHKYTQYKQDKINKWAKNKKKTLISRIYLLGVLCNTLGALMLPRVNKNGYICIYIF